MTSEYLNSECNMSMDSLCCKEEFIWSIKITNSYEASKFQNNIRVSNAKYGPKVLNIQISLKTWENVTF